MVIDGITPSNTVEFTIPLGVSSMYLLVNPYYAEVNQVEGVPTTTFIPMDIADTKSIIVSAPNSTLYWTVTRNGTTISVTTKAVDFEIDPTKAYIQAVHYEVEQAGTGSGASEEDIQRINDNTQAIEQNTANITAQSSAIEQLIQNTATNAIVSNLEALTGDSRLDAKSLKNVMDVATHIPTRSHLLTLTADNNFSIDHINKIHLIFTTPARAAIHMDNDIGNIGDIVMYDNQTLPGAQAATISIFSGTGASLLRLAPQDSCLLHLSEFIDSLGNSVPTWRVLSKRTSFVPTGIRTIVRESTSGRLTLKPEWNLSYVALYLNDLDFIYIDASNRTARNIGNDGDRIILAETSDFFPTYFDVKCHKLGEEGTIRTTEIRVYDHRQFELIKLEGYWFPVSNLSEERQIEAYVRSSRPDFPFEGMMLYNTTTRRFEGYNGRSWVRLDQ